MTRLLISSWPKYPGGPGAGPRFPASQSASRVGVNADLRQRASVPMRGGQR